MDNETEFALASRERAGTLLANSGGEAGAVELWAPDERRLRRQALTGGLALAYVLLFEGFVFWDAIARIIASHPSLFWVFLPAAIAVLPASLACLHCARAIPGLLRRRYVAADSQGFSSVGWKGSQAFPWTEVTGCSFQRFNNTLYVYTSTGKRAYINLAGFDPGVRSALLDRIVGHAGLEGPHRVLPFLCKGQMLWVRPGFQPNTIAATCPGFGAMIPAIHYAALPSVNRVSADAGDAYRG